MVHASRLPAHFNYGVQQAGPTGSASSDSTVRPAVAAVILPQGMSPMGPIGARQTAAQCVRDSATVSDDRPGRRWLPKRAHPESADESFADSQAAKREKVSISNMVEMSIEIVGAKRTADLLRCLSFFPSPHDLKMQIRILTELTSNIDAAETTIRDALNEGIYLNLSPVSSDPTKMPSDKWLASLKKSRTIIDRKLSLLTQQNLLEEFLGNSEWA